ncbi:MAG: RdgB/HAM1 family non-canonical purine NTP pyrophosphatase [Thermoproteota archaeon]|nr:RdgB/HAM1 family non-canonical purine NTP pyrophosphatase [Thermoproteota archaeon]
MEDTIIFASTNQNKFVEIQSILSTRSLSVNFLHAHLVEIQSDSLEEIAREKAKSAFAKIERQVIVEDDGLFINSLGGFPGQYSSFVFRTIGNDGILKLLSGSIDRSAYFLSLIAFYDGRILSISEGRVNGRITDRITEGGWGYDPIFVPDSCDLTFAELKNNKNEYSHRKRALEKFAQWYLKL